MADDDDDDKDDQTLTAEQKVQISENQKDASRFKSGFVTTGDTLTNQEYSTVSDVQSIVAADKDRKRIEALSRYSDENMAFKIAQNQRLKTGVLYPQLAAAISRTSMRLDQNQVHDNVMSEVSQQRRRLHDTISVDPYGGSAVKRKRTSSS